MTLFLAGLLILVVNFSLANSNNFTAEVNRLEGCLYYGSRDGLFAPHTPSPRILVTGGAGFLGSHLVKALTRNLREGQIKIVDNLRQGSLQNLQDDGGDWAINVTADVCLLDLRDAQLARQYIRGADTVFHLADSGSTSDVHFDGGRRACSENVLLNANTIMSAKENGIRTFIYSSTACDDPHEVRSFSPSDGFLSGVCSEGGNLYIWSKVMGEKQALAAASAIFQVGILRLPTVYGPHMQYTNSTEHWLLAALASWQGRTGEGIELDNSQHFVHVVDAVKALIDVHKKGLNRGPIDLHQDTDELRQKVLNKVCQ